MNATNYMIYRAAQARQAGTRLITIGLGSYGDTTNFNPVLLTNIASSADDCYVLTNTASLRSVYTNIAYSLCRIIRSLNVNFISPTNNQIFVTSPLNISLTALTIDFGGTVTNVQYFNGASLLGNVTMSTNNIWTLLWTNVGVGNYSLMVKAMDNLGQYATNFVKHHRQCRARGDHEPANQPDGVCGIIGGVQRDREYQQHAAVELPVAV